MNVTWFRFLFLFMIVGLLLVGGCREDGIRLRRVDPPADVVPPADPKDNSAGRAPRARDLAVPGLAAADAMTGNLAAVYRLFRQGELLPAQQKLTSSVSGEATGELAQLTINLLGEVLFYRQQWDRFLEYAPRYEGPIADDVPLARAYGLHPPEDRRWDGWPVSLPLRVGPTGVPMIPVTIGNKQEWFWLDTGAGMTVLTERTARRLGVAVAGEETTEATTATRRKIVVRPAVIPELAAGGIHLFHHRAVIVADEDLTFRFRRTPGEVRIRGILGWNFIRQFSVAINLPRRQVILQRSPGMAPQPGNLFWLGYPVVELRTPDGEALYFGLDTGAERTALALDFGDRHEVANPGRRQTFRLASAGGPETVETVVLRDVAVCLSSWEFTFPQIRSREIRSTEYIALDGILGADLLPLGTVVIDGETGVMDFRPERANDGH